MGSIQSGQRFDTFELASPRHLLNGLSDFVGDQTASWLNIVVGRVMLPAPLKSVVGLIWSFFPVVYCFGLDYYFIHSSGSLRDAENNGLGPTVYGLGIVGLLFCIPLLVKFVLIFIELRKPRLSVGGSSPGGGDDGFDADAVIARYMAQGKLETVSNSPSAAGGATRTRFGRKDK